MLRSFFPSLLLFAMAPLISAAPPDAPAPVETAPLKLPELLVAQDGQPITTAEAWRTKRRPEILELFRKNIYGRAPVGRPADERFEVFDVDENAMEGAATRKQVKITFSGPGGAAGLTLVLFTPRTKEPAPCFLFICNRPPSQIDPTRVEKSPFWPAEELVRRGYAAAAFFNGDVALDNASSFQTGVFAAFDMKPRPADAWGAIAAWAWGASRALDYLETDPGIDAKRVAVIGHSRGGKTALWAGAEDERFALTISNDSGCTGAAIARQKTGERIRNINKGFPYWFSENYHAFDDREEELPVDQHMLIALMAPRLAYVASAADDKWADPAHEFLGAVHAGPAFRLLGVPDLGTTQMPALEVPVQTGQIGYHIRPGKHDLTEYDWSRYLDFADRHLKKAP